MPTLPWRRPAITKVVTLGLFVALVGLLAPAPASAATAVTFKPSVVATTAAEIPNPDRGQYLWMGYAAQPAGWPAKDVYYRDQVYWGRLEKTKGTYNFSYLDTGLASAKSLGGRFSFRVMAFCPGCWMNARATWPDWGPVTPAWIPLQADGVTPDWNSETFLSGWEALMKALGDKYRADPRLGSIDVGGYGSYGEWHVPVGTVKATATSMDRIIAAVVRNFPTKHVLLNTMLDAVTYQTFMDRYPTLGLRTDSLGCPKMYSMVPDSPTLQNYWKTRPFVSEFCTRADMTVAKADAATYHISTTSSSNFPAYTTMTLAQQTAYVATVKESGYRFQLSSITVPTTRTTGAVINSTWANVGVAPAYDQWRVSLQLTSSSGAKTVVPLNVDLTKLLPGSMTFSATMPVLAKGSYAASIVVTDPTGYFPPLNLANVGRAADGSYPLGTIAL